MTDIKKMMEEAAIGDGAALAIYESSRGIEICLQADTDMPVGEVIAIASSLKRVDLICRAVNALPAVLEYMKGGHHEHCDVMTIGVIPDLPACTCGYTALTKALGVEE